jgi:hypothetical protein
LKGAILEQKWLILLQPLTTLSGDLAIAFIDAYDGTGTAPTLQQYVDAGVTGVAANNLAAVNAAVANQTASTTAQIQALANTGSNTAIYAIAAISAYDGTGTAPTIQQYVDAGVTGVTSGNLDEMNDRVATKTTAETDTTVEIQSVINTPVVVTFTIDAIANTTVAENAVFTGSTPATSGATPIGTLTYTLGGTDATDFTINSTTGVIAMVTRDFEAPADTGADNVYDVTIIATDSDGNTDSEAQIVTVTDVVETVALTIANIVDTPVDENAVFTGSTPVITGTPIGTITYSLSGADAAGFTISVTGVISMIARDFETPADANEDNAYEVTIVVTDSDANTDSETQTITVADVAEAFTSGDTFNGKVYNTVTSSNGTGQVWLDRNLGADYACGSSDDSGCYGESYQWGSTEAGHIQTSGSGIHDWSAVDSDGELRRAAWGDGDANPICPIGFRVPTSDEIMAESGNASNLKLPRNGFRRGWHDEKSEEGVLGFIWSSTIYSTPSISAAAPYSLGSNAIYGPLYFDLAYSVGVRCIEDY